jgi:GT2 family glycosyltransferase
MNAPLIFGITLNWNRRDDTLKCLESLVKSDFPNFRILVVDNGSEDGSPEAIKEHYPSVEQIINRKNLGFAGGFNQGFKFALNAGAEYILIVNNDTIVAPDMLNLLFNAILPEQVGVVSPIILYANKPNKIWSAGAGRNPWTLELTENHGRGQTFSEITERDFLSGCGMLIRRVVLENVGFFDERFFMYYEDSDFALRVRQAGYKMLLVPQARMWHSVSQSSDGTDSPNERYWMGKSSVLFFRKHIHGWRRLLIFPLRLGSIFKNTLHLLRRKKLSSARAYLWGSWEGIWFREM